MTVTRGEVGGLMGEQGKGFQKQLQRTHGQNQRGGGQKQGREVGMAGVQKGVVGGKCRQL